MILGISGKKGSGKNLVATLIYSHTERYWREKQFAEIIKKMVAALLGCSPQLLESQDFKESSIDWLNTTPRSLLQSLGTSWGRETVDNDIWVKALLSKYWQGIYDWIITDVRFPNEVEGIKKLGGLVIRINRNTNSTDTHPSETSLDNYIDWDYVIDNTGTLEELKEKVKLMCIELDL